MNARSRASAPCRSPARRGWRESPRDRDGPAVTLATSGATAAESPSSPAPPPSRRPPAASARNGTARTPAAAARAWRPWPWRFPSPARPRALRRRSRPGRRRCRWRPGRRRRPVRRGFGGDRRHRVEIEAEDRRHRAHADRDRLLHRLRRGCAAAAPRRRASARRRRASAEYSPSEWPATKAASRATSSPASLSRTRSAARLVAISAGCALAVSVSSASGPSKISLRQRFCRAPRRPPRTLRARRERPRRAPCPCRPPASPAPETPRPSSCAPPKPRAERHASGRTVKSVRQIPEDRALLRRIAADELRLIRALTPAA